MAYHAVSPANFTTVECHKQVRSWRLLRSILELLIQACTCTLVEKPDFDDDHPIQPYNNHHPKPSSLVFPTTTTNITGTIFGSRTGKVKFCIQTNPNSPSLILLLELTISTSFLAREMKNGHLRIALECTNDHVTCNNKKSLLAMPLWTMYCNGRKVGFAFKRKQSLTDIKVLKHVEKVCVGAGIVKAIDVERDDDIMYLRGNFNRVSGKSLNQSETFHLIDPDRNIGQQLSIFFFRPK
ncbi:protein MIZU-KUSSEI 1-like [Rutidosis leptorrhynchoides]|uniref:protein MIZU-KUSSEI 1-like n=1 Tax=Rutidosis leptorrhynchoides TaxID=125765 RepID=UPI003A998C41